MFHGWGTEILKRWDLMVMKKLAHTIAQSLNHALSITLFIFTGMNKNGLHLKKHSQIWNTISQYYNTTMSSFLSKSTGIKTCVTVIHDFWFLISFSLPKYTHHISNTMVGLKRITALKSINIDQISKLRKETEIWKCT